MVRFLGLLLIGAFTMNASESVSLAKQVQINAFGKFSTKLKREIGEDSFKGAALIFLGESASLSGVDTLDSKAERGKQVYDRLRKVALRTQPPIIAAVESMGLSYRRYYIRNMISVKGASVDQLVQLAALDAISLVASNASFKAIPERHADLQVYMAEPAGVGKNIKAVDADQAWSKHKITGTGIVVAGQDTGYEWKHPALKSHYRGWDGTTESHNYNWHDSIHDAIGGQSGSNPCGFSAAAPCDDSEHGTHTMGTMVGDDGKGNQIGMAPGATWVGCRNMDRGYGTPATYIECFEYFLAPYPHGGDPLTEGRADKAPHVINNSWGCPTSEGCEAQETLPVLEALMKAGVMVVASAGNEGSGCSTIASPPAMHSRTTLSVGAADNNSKIASFSSRGPSKFDGDVGPDVVAPGVNVRSSVPGGKYAGSFWSGTSMAGPHVVGLVALIWQANPGLIGSIEETVDLVRATSTPQTSSQTCGGVSGSALPNNTYGYGMINALKAVEEALDI